MKRPQDSEILHGDAYQRTFVQFFFRSGFVEERNAYVVTHQRLDRMHVPHFAVSGKTFDGEVPFPQKTLEDIPGPRPLLAKDHPPSQQVIESDGFADKIRCRPAHRDEWLFRKQRPFIACFVEEPLDTGEIDFTRMQLCEQRLRVAHLHVEFHIRILTDASAEDRRHYVLADAQRRAERHASYGIVHPEKRLQFMGAVRRSHRYIFQQSFAPLRQRKHPAVTFEQPAAVQVLQKLDVLGDRRLRDMQIFGGLRVVSNPAQGQECLVSEIDHCNHP